MSTNTLNQSGAAIITGLTATGTNQATALNLANRSSLQEITTVAASTGVILPVPRTPGTSITIANQGASTLAVFPQVGGTIDGGSANASISLAAGKSSTFEASSLTNWYTTSTTAAGSGTVSSVTFTGDGVVLSSTPSSAVTTSGTVTAALATQAPNVGLFGPTSGPSAAPTFRAAVLADLPAIADKSVYANTTGGSAAPAGVTLSALIDEAAGNAQGDVLYRGASTWSVLAPGTSGQFLQTKGAAANPQWAPTPITYGILAAFASRNLVM
jgi:hypothetical protein